MRHGDLGEQSLVLGALWNYQVAPIIFLPVGLSQVHMLEQGVADTRAGT